LHQLLASRGYYDGFECISKDYFDVIRRAVRSDEKPAMVPAE
jgi:hypothetical protein